MGRFQKLAVLRLAHMDDGQGSSWACRIVHLVEATDDPDQASLGCCRTVWVSQLRKRVLRMGARYCYRTCCALGWPGGETGASLIVDQLANHGEAKVAACCDCWRMGRWWEVTAVIVLFG
jgi:hypothetical protein